jgi:hypothetical protein
VFVCVGAGRAKWRAERGEKKRKREGRKKEKKKKKKGLESESNPARAGGKREALPLTQWNNEGKNILCYKKCARSFEILLAGHFDLLVQSSLHAVFCGT